MKPKTTIHLIFSIILFVLGFVIGCNTGKNMCAPIQNVDTVSIDTVYIPKIIKDTTKPQLVEKIRPKIIFDTLYIGDDTTFFKNEYYKLAVEYYTKNIYKDTFRLDSGFIAITDTVFKNQLLNRTYNANLYSKTITKTVVQSPVKKSSIYAGPNVMMGDLKTTSNLFGLEIDYIHKDTKWLYSFGYNTDLNLKARLYTVGVKYKLK